MERTEVDYNFDVAVGDIEKAWGAVLDVEGWLKVANEKLGTVRHVFGEPGTLGATFVVEQIVEKTKRVTHREQYMIQDIDSDELTLSLDVHVSNGAVKDKNATSSVLFISVDDGGKDKKLNFRLEKEEPRKASTPWCLPNLFAFTEHKDNEEKKELFKEDLIQKMKSHLSIASVLKDDLPRKDLRESLRSTEDAMNFIKSWISCHSGHADMLLESLKKAKDAAVDELDTKLYEAFEKLNGWPTTIDGWLDYLIYMSTWIPNQSKHPGWKHPENGYTQEVYDHVCHFHYLIDQKVGPEENKVIQLISPFDDWLAAFAILWGDFLNTTDSFNEKIFQSFKNYSPLYRVDDSMIDDKPNDPNGWSTFNEFFSRKLNPGLRPIAAANDNKVIVSPADCTFRQKFNIDAESRIKSIVLKKIHIIGSMDQLLQNSKYAGYFANGQFVHYFLGPYSYHRFHSPAAGIIEEARVISGKTYCEVHLKDGQFDAPDSSETGYEFHQSRGVIVINATAAEHGEMGYIAMIPVGMGQISSVNLTVSVGQEIKKGDEIGYFLFGGSDVILLFQKDKAPDINTSQRYRHYGSNLSVDPPVYS